MEKIVSSYIYHDEKLHISKLPDELRNKYCAVVSKHILFPREPDSGNNTVFALDAEVTYLISATLLANELVMA
jgi:hypothetical protein